MRSAPVFSATKFAYGFVRGRDIIKNAAAHTGKRLIVRVDLEDFFPSITFARVRGMFQARPYEFGEAATAVARLVCLPAAGGLPQALHQLQTQL